MSFRNKIKQNGNRAFTLVETLVGVAVFLIIATATYQAYVSLFALINQNQYKILGLNLANEQFEIIRNLTYSDVGVQGGLPNGKIPHEQTLTRGGVVFSVTITIRNVDLPFDGTIGGSPNDLSPADNKLVELEIDCLSCNSFAPLFLTTTVAPKALETSSSNGALFIRVFDANGVAVTDADVHIVNTQANPDIIIDDVTDAGGMLQIIDAPPGVEAYEITVTKAGYSTARTYSQAELNPSIPSTPHATVVVQSVTSISFAIDQLASLAISSVDPFCAPVGNFNFSLRGTKNIAASPDVSKYYQNLATNGSGLLNLNSMEWGTYFFTPTDTAYDVAGFNPLNPVALNPGAAQESQIIIVPQTSVGLLVTVKDSTTQLPVADAAVTLSKIGYDETKTTGKGYIIQSDWSGAGGYTEEIGTDETDPVGEIKLKKVFGLYNPDGILMSSTIDTGSASNFYNLIWAPSGVPASTTLKFQIATATTTSPVSWQFLGPDGTPATYYVISDSPINAIHNGDRYLRYKAFLHTDDGLITPNISDVAFTFTSSCTPPGQVFFQGITTDNYELEISRAGYDTQNISISIGSGWQNQEVILQASP
ncbi:MAG: prepilin-type N-terminal cleavage/methylation domain-containing protein [Patescibacteria group bacterium]|mgnify:CR=1 FL=1